MRIAVIAPTSIPSRRANTIQTMKMSQALANLGHTVRLVALRAEEDGDISPGSPAGGSEDISLARLYGLSLRPDPTGEQALSFQIQYLPTSLRLRGYRFGWMAFQAARQWKADLIYTRFLQSAALAGTYGVPTIFESHDLPQGRVGPRLFNRFLHSRGALRLVVITRALAHDLEQRFTVPVAAKKSDFILVLPDGVDLERFTSIPTSEIARPQLPLGLPNRFTVGYTGHLYPGRGIQLVLDLAAGTPEIGFLLVGGEKVDIARLGKQVQERGLKNVYLAGFVPNADLPLYQAACDVLLMPYQRRVSASSGGDIARYLSPMKVFEYLASGRAILSSNLPVLQEVLNPGNAILLPPDDVNAWKQAIASLEADADLRNRLAAQARLDAQGYTWEARARRILEGLPKSRTIG